MKARALSLSLLAWFGLTAAAEAADAAGPAAATSRSSAPRAGYKLLLDEIDVAYGDAATAELLGPGYAASVRAAAERAIRAAIGKHLPIVTAAGPGVVRVRAAISELRVEERPRTWLAYGPVGFIAQRIDVATGRNFTLLAAGIELELIDTQTGKSLRGVADLTAADARPGSEAAPSLRLTLTTLAHWMRHLTWWLGQRAPAAP